jgi:hypothetical protein
MKKFLVGTLMMMVFTVVLPLSASAHNNCRKHYRSARYSNAYYGYNNARYRTRSYNRRTYARRSYRQPVYYSTYQPAYYSRRPSFYRRHRNVINMAIGTGGGAILGGLLGGRRGAAIGALVGAGGSALYTYKLNPKRRRY